MRTSTHSMTLFLGPTSTFLAAGTSGVGSSRSRDNRNKQYWLLRAPGVGARVTCSWWSTRQCLAVFPQLNRDADQRRRGGVERDLAVEHLFDTARRFNEWLFNWSEVLLTGR